MKISIETICTIIGVVTGFVGVIIALIQLYEKNVLKRTEFVTKILENLIGNENFKIPIYKIEYDEEWFDNDHFVDNSEESFFDSYLSYLNYSCFLYNTKQIKEKEFLIFQYYLNSLFCSKSFLEYIKFINTFAKISKITKEKKSICPFNEIIIFAERTGKIKLI